MLSCSRILVAFGILASLLVRPAVAQCDPNELRPVNCLPGPCNPNDPNDPFLLRCLCADGTLQPEVTLLLTDTNGNGIPDVLDARDGVAKIYRDITGIFNVVDPNDPNTNTDGFRDEPFQEGGGFVITDVCNDATPGPTIRKIRVPTNHGRGVILYLFDTNPDPNIDTSVLYVGMDICNGDPYSVTAQLGTQAIDFVRPASFTSNCSYGLPATGAGSNVLRNFMPAFDSDGDGNPLTVSRVDPNLPKTSLEQYEVTLNACTPTGFIPAFRIEIQTETSVDPDVKLVLFDGDDPNGFPPDPNRYFAFPRPGTSPECLTFLAQRAFAGDPNFVRRLDVEFIIPRIDTEIQRRLVRTFPGSPPSINRLRVANGNMRLFTGVIGDLSGEDISSTALGFTVPQLEVTKEVRCLTGGQTNFGPTVTADPNSDVEFRITVRNSGNSDLAVYLRDFLEEFAPVDFQVNPASLSLRLFRDSDPNYAGGRVINAGNAAAQTPRFNPAFFAPGNFLALNNTDQCMGVMRGIDVCNCQEPNTPFDPNKCSGDRVVITFSGRVVGNPCTPIRQVDVRNTITALGDENIQGDPNNPDTIGPCSADPTPVFETQAGPVSVTVNVLCRGITLVKDARVCTSCTDPNTPAACSGFADPLTLPSVPAGGLCVQYRYRVTNNTDPNESPDPNFTTETVRIFDNQLCTDALAVGATIGPCDVCPAGSTPFPVLAGQTVTKTCTIKFATQAILDAFIARNDPNRPCPPAGFNDPRPGGHGTGAGPTSPFGPGEAVSGDAIIRLSDPGAEGGDDPADNWSEDADPERDTRAGCGCYRNCATATATNAAVCPGTPRGAFDTAQVCKTSCTLEVGKKVECLDCDPNRPTTCFSPTDPNNACPPSGLADPNEPNLLQASQGSRIRYTVTVRNVLDPNCGNIPLCRVLFRDLLNPNDPNCVAIDPNTARIVRANGSEFAVPGFNVAGNSFNLLLSSVGGNLPATAAGDPNGALRLRFDGRVGAAANPACDPNNTVTVWGLIPVDGNCPTLADPNDPNLYTCFAGDTARVDVRRVGLTALKQWSAVWDDDANCDPNDPNDPNTGFRTCLNLRDIVFPAILTLRVTGTNTGEDDLCVDPNDPSIACVIGKPGITVLQNEFIPPVSKVITPAGTATWTLRIRVDSAAAARSLASCGSGNDPNDPNCQCGTADPNCPPCYRNTVTLRGRVIPKGRICPVDTSATASATICPPPECRLDVTKQVVCVNCADPNVQIGSVADHVDALPGSCQKFIIRITNTGLVKLPQLRIDDDLTLAAGLDPTIVDTASVRARIIPTAGAPVNVTACFSTFGDNVKTGTAACYKFAACRPLAPWLAPGEVLEITFKITIPPAFVDGGTPVDITNTVNVRGYTEACDSVCGTASVCDKTDSSTVNVKKPSLICDKALGLLDPNVVFDPNIPSTFPPGGFTSNLDIQINDANLPIQLVYRYGVTNNGEVRMVNVALIDDELVKDAKFANATFGLCQLCDVAGCDGVGDTTILFGTLNVAESKVGYCAIRFPTGTDFLNFLRTDDEPNSPDPNDPNCYLNRARPRGEPNEPNVCLPIPNPPFEPNTFCEAEVCVRVSECVCPPTKADVLVWNEDEISLGGMHRCVYAWDERYASNWTWGYPGVPNIWTIAALHTNSAFAQIDGVASPAVCGDCSIPAPFIGTFFHVIQFYDPNSTDPNRPFKVEYAGGAMAGKGLQAGQLKVPFDPNGGPESVKQAGRPTPGISGIDLPPAGGGGGPQRSGGEQPDDANAPSTIRVSTSTKGSLLIYPKVEVKWDAQGKLIQDTFIQVNNDNRNAGVHVNMLWINGNDPNLCDSEHFDTDFTHQQAVWFSAALGTPLGAVPFSVVAPRIPDTDPRNPGGTRVHGALLIWAVDLTGREIKWNNLFGEATIVNYKLAAAIDYNAYAFRAIAGADDGALLLPPYGTLDLNAIEYDMPANTLVFPFFAVDAVVEPANGGKFRVLDLDIALMPLLRDYTTQTHP